MSTILNIYYNATPDTPSDPGTVELVFRPHHYLYFNTYQQPYSGVGIDSANPDPGNEVFASLQDALDFYMTDSFKIPSLIETINNAEGTDFVIGELRTSVPDIYEDIALKQDHTENLDFWTEVAPNSHIEEMMTHAAKSHLHEYLEVGTAAFEDIEYFATAGDLSNKVDKVTGKGLSTEDYSSAEKTKLAGVASGATANDTDANLKARANHTGSQAISTVTNLQTTLDGKASSTHTHVANDITDATSTGKAVLTAASQSAARTAIGAGTSSFDGTWGSLTGKPSFATVATSGNYYDLTTKPAAKSVNNAPSISIQTTAAAANGDRLSTFRDATVNYSVDIQTTVSLAGNSTGYVVLEIAATNSTTASDWKEIARTTSGQSGTLVVGLTLNQIGGGNLSGVVPAGYYRRLRSVNTAGTPTYTVRGCQESLDEPLQVAA